MKAVRWHAARDVRLDEIPEPSAAAGEVVIAVAACGLCGSDLHEYLHGPVYIPKTPHPLTGATPPIVLGHEFSGRVAQVGTGVESLRVGARVTVNPCQLTAAIRCLPRWTICRAPRWSRWRWSSTPTGGPG